MSKRKAITGLLSAVFVLTLVSSARADVVHADMYLEKLIFAERHDLIALESRSAEVGYLYAEHFENNNGKHLGFSLSAVTRGPRLGIVKPVSPNVSVSQNPEPTAMVLLGTGLAAIAAFARKKSRKRRI
ncbi:MAG TPA: PEP-CTERM sorting domain-containing protein [Pyrinomonadaceae bacterium]|nr:PEP-CTERM sorting domain-containing protein [Pyrinomonadaceae bacterium]